MPSEPEQSVLRRMVAPPRQSLKKQGGGAEHANIHVQFPRVADQLLGMAIEVTSVSHQRLQQEAVVASVQETDLIYTLAGPGGALGMAVVDGALLAALIEVQTTGRVATRPAPERVPSRTDGVVASDIVDRWLREAASPEENGSPSAFSDSHRENRQLDLRAVALTLDPGPYEVLKVTMSLGDGAKTGVLSFSLPATARSGASRAGATLTAREAVEPVPTDLVVDMTRFSVPLSRVLGLTEDMLLPIPDEHLGLATLRGIDGSDFARMSLGHMSGRWAIRKPPSDSPGDGSSVPDFASLSLAGDTEHLAVEDETTLLDDRGALEPMPELPDLNSGSGAMDLPDLDSGPGLPDLPDLTDLPDLPDLPDLTDLPDLSP